MLIEEISFPHWFMETKAIITPQLYKTINPHIMKFYRCDKVYLIIAIEADGSLNVLSAIGKGITWIHEIHKQCKAYNIGKVIFTTSQYNKTVHTIAKYCGAEKIEEIKDYYGENDNAWIYLIEFAKSPRFKDKK